MGMTLGLLGSGGSILTVPIFVYLFAMDASLATTSSLVVVGAAAAYAVIRYHQAGHVRWSDVMRFAVPSSLGVAIARRVLRPALPTSVNLGSLELSQSDIFLLVFAILMIFAAVSMLKPTKTVENVETQKSFQISIPKLVISAFGVGLLTGFVGAGGGFLIVPVLVVFLGTPMSSAIASSLSVISLNSLVGLIFDGHLEALDWSFLLKFLAVSIVGILLGTRLQGRLDSKKLRKVFAYFTLMTGSYILLQRIFQ